jgi:hypothetical protein
MQGYLLNAGRISAGNIDAYIKKITCGEVVSVNDLTYYEAQEVIAYQADLLKEEKAFYKSVTAAQIRKIYVILQQKGLMDEKGVLVYSISDGRTESTRELTCHEAKRLIDFLLDDASEKINDLKKSNYKAVWRIALEMNMIYGDTDDDYQMNKAKLNMFCHQHGTVRNESGGIAKDTQAN